MKLKTQKNNIQKFLNENPQYVDAYIKAYNKLVSMMREGKEGEVIYYYDCGLGDPEYGPSKIKIPKRERIPQFASNIMAFAMFNEGEEFGYMPTPDDFRWK